MQTVKVFYIAHVDATVRVLGPVTTGTDTAVSYRFQPDGPLIAVVRDRELSILDVDTGELRANLSPESSTSASVATDRATTSCSPLQ